MRRISAKEYLRKHSTINPKKEGIAADEVKARREKLAADVEEFLASGGRINKIPRGTGNSPF